MCCDNEYIRCKLCGDLVITFSYFKKICSKCSMENNICQVCETNIDYKKTGETKCDKCKNNNYYLGDKF